MDFLVYSRAVPESEFPTYTEEDERRQSERHWAYMDGFADRFTARGPTLGPDRDSWTGSLHIVDLADDAAAQAFVEQEPNEQLGLYAGHSVWRFTNLLGRTMWEFPNASDDPKFLVLVEDETPPPVPVDQLSPAWRDALVVYGALSTVTGEPAGFAAAIQVPTRNDRDRLLTDPTMRLRECRRVQVEDWEFGGRR